MRVETKLEWDDGLPEAFFEGAKDGAFLVAKKIQRTARGMAPRGKTGNLKKGITAGRSRKGLSMAFVYANAPHSHLIEYGHQVVRGGKLGKGGKVVGHAPAKPYLRPALERNRRLGTVVFSKEMKKIAAKSGK